MAELDLNALTQKIQPDLYLSAEDCHLAAQCLASDAVPDQEKKAFLFALHYRGESPDEIAHFARAFQEKARQPSPELAALAEEAIDFVGTGGDGSGAFNISTAVCFILASAGVRVMKHGNRGATSPSGTADLQEALGLHWEWNDAQLQTLLHETHYAFFFAPAFHPAFKHIVPVRKALAAEGKRTIFNILGPLIHPAQPALQVLGVYSKKWVDPMASTLEKLHRKRGYVIHGTGPDGEQVDKALSCGLTAYRGVGELATLRHEGAHPDAFGLTHHAFDSIKSGTPGENASRLLSIFEGNLSDSLADTLLLNAGMGLHVAKHAQTVNEGISMAMELILSGTTLRWLKKTQTIQASLR